MLTEILTWKVDSLFNVKTKNQPEFLLLNPISLDLGPGLIWFWLFDQSFDRIQDFRFSASQKLFILRTQKLLCKKNIFYTEMLIFFFVTL